MFNDDENNDNDNHNQKHYKRKSSAQKYAARSFSLRTTQDHEFVGMNCAKKNLLCTHQNRHSYEWKTLVLMIASYYNSM